MSCRTRKKRFNGNVEARPCRCWELLACHYHWRAARAPRPGPESGDRSSRVGAGKPASDGRRRHLQCQLGDIPRIRWGKYRHTAAERGAGYGSRRLWNRLVLPSEHTSACRASLSVAATVPASADPPYAQIQTLAPVNFHQTEARWREARNLSPCRMTAPAKTTRIEGFRERDPFAFPGQPHARRK